MFISPLYNLEWSPYVTSFSKIGNLMTSTDLKIAFQIVNDGLPDFGRIVILPISGNVPGKRWL
jgi:hypothetical protein